MLQDKAGFSVSVQWCLAHNKEKTFTSQWPNCTIYTGLSNVMATAIQFV